MKDSSLAGKAAAGAKWTGLSQTVSGLLQLLQMVVLARCLGLGDFGVVTIILVALGLAGSFADLGLSNAIIHRQDCTRAQLASLYWLNIIGGAATCLLLAASAPFIARLYGEARLLELIPVAALSLLITAFGQQYHVLLQKDLRFDLLAKAVIGGTAAGTAVAISAAASGAGPVCIVWGQLALAGTRTLLLASLGSEYGGRVFRLRPSEVRRYLTFGLYQMGERALNFLSRNFDKALIGALLGSEALGLYSAAFEFALRPMGMINPILSQVGLPLLARVQDDASRLRRGYLRLIEMVAFLNAPVYLAMAVLAEPLILLTLGDSWGGAARLLRILAVLGFLRALANPIGNLLVAKGRADIGFLWNVLALSVYSTSLLMSVHGGLDAIAWGLVASCGLILFPMDFWVRWRLVGMKPGVYFAAFLPFLAAAAVMAAGLAVLSISATDWPPAILLSAAIPVGAGLYLGSLTLLKGPFLKQTAALVADKRTS